jgi:hypothetical protein
MKIKHNFNMMEQQVNGTIKYPNVNIPSMNGRNQYTCLYSPAQSSNYFYNNYILPNQHLIFQQPYPFGSAFVCPALTCIKPMTYHWNDGVYELQKYRVEMTNQNNLINIQNIRVNEYN